MAAPLKGDTGGGSHVGADRAEVDFDHHSSTFLGNRHEEWAELRRCPVAFSPRYGGFWVVSGYDEVKAVARDIETYSSEYRPDPPDGVPYLGICGLPRAPGIPPAGIAEAEPGLHQVLRRVLNPFLLPPAVARTEPFAREVTTWFLDQKVATGEMDLVLDLLNPVPAVMTMQLIGLPCAEWEPWADLFHATVAHPPRAPEYARAVARVPEMMAGLLAEAAERRRDPRDDVLSALVECRVDGRALTDEELTAVLWNLVGGGLDTTTSLTALALHHLDGHHGLRRQLMAHPELLGPATEEFLRYFSVNETLTRTVTTDVQLGDQQLHRGDRVLLSWLSANLDEGTFDDAESVVLDRSPNPHLAFGVGPYRCIGMHAARSMFAVMMTEVLTRIGDYEIDREQTRFYQANPQLAGVVAMPARFTPGPTVGPAERPF
jgi:cytochrome P450